jgi:hypothetical protein
MGPTTHRSKPFSTICVEWPACSPRTSCISNCCAFAVRARAQMVSLRLLVLVAHLLCATPLRNDIRALRRVVDRGVSPSRVYMQSMPCHVLRSLVLALAAGLWPVHDRHDHVPLELLAPLLLSFLHHPSLVHFRDDVLALPP